MKFSVQLQILVSRMATLQSIEILQIQNGGRPPYLKSFLAISLWLIVWLMQIVYKKQKHSHTEDTWPKIPNFENSRWRTAPILKIVLLLYLSRESSDFNDIWCAVTDFGSMNGHMTKYRNFANSKWRPAATLKIVFGYISTIYCPTNAKFGVLQQNHAQTQVTWPKYQISKTQDGGQMPF